MRKVCARFFATVGRRSRHSECRRKVSAKEKRRGPATPVPAFQIVGPNLEHDLGAELQYAGAPLAGRRSILPARRVGPRRIDCIEFGVVEGVVRFRAEFEVSPFGDRKVLVERGCAVDTARSEEGAFPAVAETEIGTTLITGGRRRKRSLRERP